MAWLFSPGESVYLQIARICRERVLSGEYPPGSQFPPVRKLSLEAAVNPNTVQKALTLLEEEGLIENRGTSGKFVTTDGAALDFARKTVANAAADEYLIKTRRLGLCREEIEALIRERSIKE